MLLRLAGRGRAESWSAAAGALAPIATLAVHEAGHALAAGRTGTPTEAIVLTPFSGATVLAGRPANPEAEGAFFASGAAGNLVMAGLSSALLRVAPRGPGGQTLQMLRLLNIGLAATNLLPIGQLDGGRLVQAARWGVTGDRDLAARESVEIGRVIGGSLCGIGLVALGARRRLPGGLPAGLVGLGLALLLGDRLGRALSVARGFGYRGYRAGGMSVLTTEDAPILDHPTDERSVFLPENLLDRAAAMHGKERGPIPRCCVLDFDSELVPVAVEQFGAEPCAAWSCFHTTLLRVERDGFEMGIIPGTVGAPYAVLVAEELIASGCRHIIAYSSAGAVADWIRPPCLVVPERALRDEGTSYHYLPPARLASARGRLPAVLARHADDCGLPVHRGLSWTTDAPYRETQSQIDRHRAAGVLCVEMEAAALMALAEVRGAEIASLLHVTNVFATDDNDFEKGGADIHERIIRCCLASFAESRVRQL